MFTGKHYLESPWWKSNPLVSVAIMATISGQNVLQSENIRRQYLGIEPYLLNKHE